MNTGQFKKGYVPWNKGVTGRRSHRFGRKWSVEVRKIMSIKKRGNKSPLWKGGVSKQNELDRKSVEYKLWREAVYKRDGYQCQDCGAKSTVGKRITLHPHHIKHFAKYKSLRFAIDNGITLCFDCHQKRHKNLKLTKLS